MAFETVYNDKETKNNDFLQTLDKYVSDYQNWLSETAENLGFGEQHLRNVQSRDLFFDPKSARSNKTVRERSRSIRRRLLHRYMNNNNGYMK